MCQRVLQFRLASSQGGGIVEMLDVFGAVRLNDHQFEALAAGSNAGFASDKRTVPFVEPHHLRVVVSEGWLSLA
jgi:hypothetical protein